MKIYDISPTRRNPCFALSRLESVCLSVCVSHPPLTAPTASLASVTTAATAAAAVTTAAAATARCCHRPPSSSSSPQTSPPPPLSIAIRIQSVPPSLQAALPLAVCWCIDNSDEEWRSGGCVWAQRWLGVGI